MGWATDDHHAELARAACLLVDGKIFRQAETRYHLARPDIASGFRNEKLRDAGFQITLRTGRLPSGTHRLAVAVVTSSGKVGGLSQTLDITSL